MEKRSIILKKEENQILNEKHKGIKNVGFFNDLEKLKKGVPVDYIIGWVDFLNCKIDLSLKPLIPRVETEFWVEKVIMEILELSKDNKLKVLDIFSGSGCIGVSILKNCPNTKVDFAEVNSKFIKQIKKNLSINKILYPSSLKDRGRANIIQSNIFDNIKDKYDIILANPPYVSTNRRGNVQRSVLEYEPSEAVFGGKDGLFFIRDFLAKAKDYLLSKGNIEPFIYLEFDSFQKSKIENMLAEYNYSSWQFFKDQFNRWRFAKIFK